jgi:hypothetical protein
LLDTSSPLCPEDRAGVARRLRELFANSEGLEPGAVARRLGISEIALRMSIDEESPRPTAEVLVAAVRYHGVDPNWLLTGEYDLSVHRKAIDGDRETTAAVVSDVVQRRNTPPGRPALNINPTSSDRQADG